ncbi:hypothetical protein BDV96DRAFT_650659 [Lophiotrema nucula]|uniref:Uncharacterized protein n=1 Tax=Lophiotrema nucula TaxID=690887 RepID=A0A6A5YWN1_9PLEO|nr:hypothetical protein BDV96DRAFT_650659 [Lophiotrema nucula]
MPPPLQIPPSRARRQFAARLAQRKALLEATREQEEDPEAGLNEDERKRSKRDGQGKFSGIFEGIDDDEEEDEGGEGSSSGEEGVEGEGDRDGGDGGGKLLGKGVVEVPGDMGYDEEAVGKADL